MPPERAYWPRLDALRGLAVVSVMLEHFLPKGILTRFPWGTLGLRLFFVLSGFLITEILLALRTQVDSGPLTIREAFGRFYVRRSLRIFPAYYCAIALSVAFNLPNARGAFFWFISYTTNFWIFKHGGFPYPMGHFWSLAVEEQFYLIWPWIILLCPKKWLVPSAIGAVFLAPLTRLVCARIGIGGAPLETLPWCCMDSLGMGALVAISRPFFREHVGKVLAVGCGVAAASVALYVSGRLLFPVSIALPTALSLAFAGLIYQCISAKVTTGRGLLDLKPLQSVGRVSYGVYLYHGLLRAVPLPEGAPRIIGLMVLSILVGYLSWYAVELPFLRMRPA